jgi:hypothetical protein
VDVTLAMGVAGLVNGAMLIMAAVSIMLSTLLEIKRLLLKEEVI